MKYVPPIGGAANDPYVDADPGLGIEGSAVPEAALEAPLRELDALITGAGLTPDPESLVQVLAAVLAIASGTWTVGADYGVFLLPGGRRLQWVSFTNPTANVSVEVTLPETFETAVYSLVAMATGLNQYAMAGKNGASLSTVLASTNQSGGGGIIWVIGK